jgi:hypothetical protein
MAGGGKRFKPYQGENSGKSSSIFHNFFTASSHLHSMIEAVETKSTSLEGKGEPP